MVGNGDRVNGQHEDKWLYHWKSPDGNWGKGLDDGL